MSSPDPDSQSAFRTYALFSGVALEFGASVAAGVYGGQWLDEKFGTEPWLVVLGVMLGSATGFYLLYKALVKNKAENDRMQNQDD